MAITDIRTYSDRTIDRKYEKLNKERIIANVGAKALLAGGTYFGVKAAAKEGSVLQRGIDGMVNTVLNATAKTVKFVDKKGKLNGFVNVLDYFKRIHPAVKGVAVVLFTSTALFLNSIKNNAFRIGVLAQAKQDEKDFNRVKRTELPDVIEQAKLDGGMEILSALCKETETGKIKSFQG